MRFRRTIGTAAAASALVFTGVVSTAGPASAAHIVCGVTITENTTLNANLGPCAGTDGIIIGADNITLNLNGYKIIGKKSNGDNAGVRLVQRTGVTIRKGTVQGFDAGVAIFGGSGNTVTNLTVKFNVNDFRSDNQCDMGDGISLTNSDNNLVSQNRVVDNGPYGGISLVADSDGNQIRGNTVVGHDIQSIPGSGCGNTNQDEGIRIEGPGANNNTVSGNKVTESSLSGIGVHGHVGCAGVPLPPGPIATPPNDFNSILNNTVTATAGTEESDGIKILDQGPFGTVVCAASNTTIVGNNSSNNERNGIQIPGTSINNTVNTNTVNANGVDGIALGGPIFRNVFTDIGPSVLDLITPDLPTFMAGTDYRALNGSGTGDVTAPLVAVGAINVTQPIAFDTATSGCDPADFIGFPADAVALIQRGFCARDTKVQNAINAGASAVIFFNEGSVGREGLVVAGVGPKGIPVMDATFATGKTLYNLTLSGPVTIRVATNTTNVATQIYVGAENNTLIRNTGFNNGEHDGHDDNENCDNNAWSGNMFGTVNKGCVKNGGGTGQITNPAP